MKGFLAAVGGMIVIASTASAEDQTKALAQAAPAPPQWTTTFSTETRYDWYRTDRTVFGFPSTTKQEGWEVYTPISAQVSGNPIKDLQLDLSLHGGWVDARQITVGQSGQVATATDTTASATFTYQGFQGVQPFLAIDTNLPTGKPALFGAFAPNARLDPDFVDVSSFGEGFNIGPTFGFNFPISAALIFTTSVGYTWRGVFFSEGPFIDANTPQSTTRTNPGDDLTVTAGGTLNFGNISINLTGTVGTETSTTINKLRTFRPGDRYTLSTQITYNWAENWGATTLSGSAVYGNRNQIVFVDANGHILNLGNLGGEPFNSNSTIYQVQLQHMFPVGQFQVGPTGSFLDRRHNSYDPVALQFVPAKTRWSAGALAQYAPNPALTFNARVEGIWIHENDNPTTDDLGVAKKFDPITQTLITSLFSPAVSGTGLQASLGMNIKF